MNIEEMQTQRDADYETYKAEGRIWGTVPREKIVQIQIPRTSKEVIDRYYALEDMSTAVSDILDTYGIHGAVPNTCLKPVKAGSRLVGTAVTVRSIPSRKTATQGQRDKDKILMSTKDIFYLGEAGDVLVSDLRRQSGVFQYRWPELPSGESTWICRLHRLWKLPRYGGDQPDGISRYSPAA